LKPNEEENKEKGEPENKEQEKGKKKREFLVYKYCNRKKGDLHEAVILGGKPAFLKYTSGLRELASLYNDTAARSHHLIGENLLLDINPLHYKKYSQMLTRQWKNQPSS